MKKPWGETERPGRMSRIFIERGGYSSEHRHPCHANAFIVLDGSVAILSRDEPQGAQHTCIISAGEAYTVPAGVWHMFRALKDAIVIEAYWSGADMEYDGTKAHIERRGVGGTN